MKMKQNIRTNAIDHKYSTYRTNPTYFHASSRSIQVLDLLIYMECTQEIIISIGKFPFISQTTSAIIFYNLLKASLVEI